MPAVSHRRHVCCVTQQTRLPCHTAVTYGVSNSENVCCIVQQTCLLRRTAESPPQEITFSGLRKQPSSAGGPHAILWGSFGEPGGRPEGYDLH